jgi:type I restriction enzyme S subunit
MMKAIIDNERGIRQRHQSILCLIDKELKEKYNGSNFIYSHPTTQEIHSSSRLDTGLYCVGFRKFKHRVDSYYGGSTTLSKMGVKSRAVRTLRSPCWAKLPTQTSRKGAGTGLFDL